MTSKEKKQINEQTKQNKSETNTKQNKNKQTQKQTNKQNKHNPERNNLTVFSAAHRLDAEVGFARAHTKSVATIIMIHKNFIIKSEHSTL